MRGTRPMIPLLVLLLSGTASADDREAAALATKLAKMQTPKAQYEGTMRMMLGQIQQNIEDQARSAGQEFPSDLSARLLKETMNLVPYEEIIDLHAGVWVKHFSVDELRALIRFHESPVGRKLATKQPEIARDMMGMMMPLMMQRMPKVMKKLEAEGLSPAAKPKR